MVRAARGIAAAVACLALANCASSGKFANRVDPRYGVSSSPRVVAFGEPVPKGGGTYRVGKPYIVGGRVYVPEEDVNYREEGLASWYGDDFHGRLTANGEVFDMGALTAAHPTLPMPCYARVTNLSNGRSLIVRVNDRGPYHGNRLIDVSNKAAELLEFKGNGVARVRVEYVGRAPLEGSDDRLLMATLRTGVPAPSPSLVRVASARPFVPEISSGRPIRGEVPTPEGRPYSLGSTPADLGSIAATSEMSASAAAVRVATSSKIRARCPMKTMSVSPRQAGHRLCADRSARTERDTGRTRALLIAVQRAADLLPRSCWNPVAGTRDVQILPQAGWYPLDIDAPCCLRYFQLLERRLKAPPMAVETSFSADPEPSGAACSRPLCCCGRRRHGVRRQQQRAGRQEGRGRVSTAMPRPRS